MMLSNALVSILLPLGTISFAFANPGPSSLEPYCGFPDFAEDPYGPEAQLCSATALTEADCLQQIGRQSYPCFVQDGNCTSDRRFDRFCGRWDVDSCKGRYAAGRNFNCVWYELVVEEEDDFVLDDYPSRLEYCGFGSIDNSNYRCTYSDSGKEILDQFGCAHEPADVPRQISNACAWEAGACHAANADLDPLEVGCNAIRVEHLCNDLTVKGQCEWKSEEMEPFSFCGYQDDPEPFVFPVDMRPKLCGDVPGVSVVQSQFECENESFYIDRAGSAFPCNWSFENDVCEASSTHRDVSEAVLFCMMHTDRDSCINRRPCKWYDAPSTDDLDISSPAVSTSLFPTTAPESPSAPLTQSPLSTTLIPAPSAGPYIGPTVKPSEAPSVSPSMSPSMSPSLNPSQAPSMHPTLSPIASPKPVPTYSPIKATLPPTRSFLPTTASPTFYPTLVAQSVTTKSPTTQPNASPSPTKSTLAESGTPSPSPFSFPTLMPSKDLIDPIPVKDPKDDSFEEDVESGPSSAVTWGAIAGVAAIVTGAGFLMFRRGDSRFDKREKSDLESHSENTPPSDNDLA